MKKIALALVTALAFSVPAFAQTLTCSNGTSQKTQTVNNYDYELWSQNGAGTATLNITANDNPANGGTFTAQWNGTINVLSRAGKKFKNNETVSSVGNITVDFAATWSSGDNVKMLGVYGWGYFASGQNPTKQENGTSANFSDQIEYYIIQDRGSYNSAIQGTNCKQYGSATIDGIAYNFTVCDRINEAMLTGKGNFKQYFSYPASTSQHRTSGMITVSQHFAEWAKVGMTMNKLYEVAMKVESYTGSSQNANGTANVTKNILTIGGSLPSSSSAGTSSSSSVTSSSSANNTQSSSSSESGGEKVQATTCSIDNFAGDFPLLGVPSAPYTACFKYNEKCYTCKISSEGEGNTCASDWVWTYAGTDNENINNNISNGYWYYEVDCDSSTPIQKIPQMSKEPTFSIYDLNGNLIKANATQMPKLSAGIYVVKKANGQMQKVMVK